MAQQIEVPGMGIVEFPDGMSDDQIAAAIKANQPAPEASAPGGGLARAGQLTKVGASGLASGVAKSAGFLTDIGGGGRGPVQLPGGISIPIPPVLAAMFPKFMQANAPALPNTKAVGEAVTKHLPQPNKSDPTERYLHSGAEGVGGALIGPGVLQAPFRTAAIGAGAGTGGQGAADLFGDNMLTRGLGALAGGLGTAGLMAPFTNQKELAQAVLRDVRPKDLTAAGKNMQQAKAQGVDINLSQAMPRASNIDSMVERLANSASGAKVTEQLRKQPGQVSMGMEGKLAGLPGTIREPHVLANNLQDSADDVIRQGYKQASAAWAQHAKPGAALKEASVARLDRELAAMAKAYPNTASADMINDVRAALRLSDAPPTNAAGSALLDATGNPINGPATGPKYLTNALQVKGAVDDVLQNFGARKLNTPSITGKELRRAQEIRKMLTRIIEAESPELARANRAYSQVISGVVNPDKKSVVGRLAGPIGSKDDREAVVSRAFSTFEAGTTPGAKSSEILTLARKLKTVQPTDKNGMLSGADAYQDAAKSWLAKKVSAALKPADNRQPDDIAKNLTKVFGDPRQPTLESQGLKDVLAGMAMVKGEKPTVYVKGVQNFMKAVNHAARRPGEVRGIDFQGIDDVAGKSTFGSVGRFSWATPVRQPILKWVDWLQRDSLEAMDSLLTSPEGIATLQKLAKQAPTSQAAASTIAAFMATQAQVNRGETPGD